MISIICLYNNEIDYKNIFLKGLVKQKSKYELIPIDNTRNLYKSPSEAYNIFSKQTKGNFILFTNQFLYFGYEYWLKDVERMLNALPDLGIAGILGVSNTGKKWKDRIRTARGVYDEKPFSEIIPIENPEEVSTLDDCLLIVPKKVFTENQFDARTFDGLFFYGADLCLSLINKGLKAYCLPVYTINNDYLSNHLIWEARQINISKKAIYRKYKINKRIINTHFGVISNLHLISSTVITFIYNLSLYMHLFITNVIWHLIIPEGKSVLNIGCGYHFPVDSKRIKFSVGIEIYEPSLYKSKSQNVHTHYIIGDARAISFKPNSFDIVTSIEVLEHLTRDEGNILLKSMETWAKELVIITTPNGYLDQDEYDLNPYQIHKSGWNVKDFKKLGYKVRGLQGLKILKGERGMVKYNPFFFWTVIANISGLLTYFFPKHDHRLLAVKKIEK
ncbi:MAG TPA: glycosyltransferase [Spirochaetota bacterium]|nr:glycosyltransferase [Spirochaetota bacterium]